MRPALRISLNVLNALVLPFGVLVAYEAFGSISAQLGFPRMTSHGRTVEKMYTTSAFFGLLATTIGIMGAFLVNIDAVILRTFYSITLGAMALIFVLLWILTHEFLDEFTDDMVFHVYRATFDYYHQPDQKEFLDQIQQYAHCCGSRGVKYFRNQTVLPASCCPAIKTNTSCTNSTAYKHTCEVRATRQIVKQVFRLSTTSLSLAGYFTLIITLEMMYHAP